MLKKLVAVLSLLTLTFAAAAADPVAPLNFKKLIVPVLKPVGSGDLTGSVVHYVLRGEHVVYVCAKDGEEIKFNVKHFGNASRPMGIRYALIDRLGNVLKEGVITHGKLETIACRVEKGDTYAFVINSGSGPAPWYSVATKNPFAALAATGKEIYLFGQQTIYVPGKALNDAEMQIRTTPKESYVYSIDGGEKVSLTEPKLAKLPLPEKEVVKIQFSRLPKTWCQNFMISFPGGKTPFIFFGPNRAVDIVR
jgi:hypothetical protein